MQMSINNIINLIHHDLLLKLLPILFRFLIPDKQRI